MARIFTLALIASDILTCIHFDLDGHGVQLLQLPHSTANINVYKSHIYSYLFIHLDKDIYKIMFTKKKNKRKCL